MGHVPNIGRGRSLPSAAEELTQSPQPELLGSISPEALKKITEEPPPPWETDPRYQLHDTNARRFVQVPDNWELRWLSPRMIRQFGKRDWLAVSASDPRVKVHNDSMIAVDNTLRKGGDDGDLLCWMYKSWVESRGRMKAETVRKRTASARDRQQEVREQINRGSFGRYVSVEKAVHPTHTIGDGRSMTD